MAKLKTNKSQFQNEFEVDFGNRQLAHYHNLLHSKSDNTLFTNNYAQFKAKTYTTPPTKLNTITKAKKKLELDLVERFKLIPDSEFTLNLRKLDEPLPEKKKWNCAVGFKMGKTKSGLFFKQIVCGKEFCATCGHDYSIAHSRRIVRALPKVMQMDNAGYMVITIPDFLRDRFKNKKNLNEFRNYVRRKLKRGWSQLITVRDKKTNKVKNFYRQHDQIKRAFIRWHWCGDDGVTWKPHLNIIIDHKHLNSFYLSMIKRDVSDWFKFKFGLDFNPIGNVYYQYVNKNHSNPERAQQAVYKIKHWINYITRATAKNLNDPGALDTIHGYRNISYLGKFGKVNHESISRGASIISNGIDQETGEKITWSELISPKVFKAVYLKYSTDLGCGVYFVLVDST